MSSPFPEIRASDIGDDLRFTIPEDLDIDAVYEIVDKNVKIHTAGRITSKAPGKYAAVERVKDDGFGSHLHCLRCWFKWYNPALRN